MVAFDVVTAVAISSGKGKNSKVYRTVDGCKTWQVVFDNPEADSSFDTLRRVGSRQVYLLAEPVAGKFPMYLSQDGGQKWYIADDEGLNATAGESAAGSAMVTSGPFLYFGTGGGTHPRLHFTRAKCSSDKESENCAVEWTSARFPAEAGALQAVATRTATNLSGKMLTFVIGIANDQAAAMSSVSSDPVTQWSAPQSFPLRSPMAVAFLPAKQKWIAVGVDGIATSDSGGKHWLKSAEAGRPADSGWSAISLPFAVGSSGRIGQLDSDRLQ